MKTNLDRPDVRFAIVLFVAGIGIAAIWLWGYYQGLNVLIPCALLCLAGGIIRRNTFLISLAVGICAAYLALSAVTIAQ